MTISNQTARTGPYNGNGSTTVFAYDFRALDQTDIVVTLKNAANVETVQTLTTNYTVSGVGGASGGNITMGVAPASGEQLTISRAVPQTQIVDLANRGAVAPEVLEGAYDKLTQLSQDKVELLNRMPRFPVSSSLTGVELPLTLTANTVLTVNAGGTGYTNGPTASQISGAEASAVAAAASAASAATSYDNFDDRYLGQKSSDPSVDNDGDALLTGALYFNTSNNVMLVYTGSAWVRTTPTTGDQANIDAVTANATNINTVAGVAANVTTVAGVAANVTTVAGIASDVTAVAGDATDIGAVAAKATEIGRLGTSDAVADMNTLGTAAIVADMDLLATSANVTAMGLLGVSDVITDMGLLGTTDAVADMALLGTSDAVSDMNTLGTSGNVTNMNTLAGIAANVTTVAGIAANVTTTAGISADVTTVAGISGDVSAVAAQVIGYDFSTTTAMADPGAGNVRFNNATLASVSQIAIDDLDKNGVDQSAFIILWDDSTNTVKGTLVFRTAGGDVATFLITGLTDNAGWSQVAVTHVASSGTFGNGEDTFIGFTRAGDKGADGEGAGDVIGPASATDNTVARYDNTTGKLIQGSGVTIDDSNLLTVPGGLAVNKGGDIASASPLVIDTDGGYFDVTGTTGFSAITVAANRLFTLQWDGIVTVTHGAALVLPGGANLTTAAGDVWTCYSTAANTVVVTNVATASPSGGGGLYRGNNGTTGTSSGDIFRINATTLTLDEAIESGENASAAGPLSIASGITLTINGALVIL